MFDFGEGPFWNLVKDIRLQVLEAGAKHGIKGVITTFCYVRGEDEAVIRHYMRRLKKHKVRFLFVHLSCRKEELLRRAAHPSRKLHRKITSPRFLRKHLEEKEFYTPISHPTTLVIDNTSLSPRKAAKMIQQHFRLKAVA